MNDGELVAKAMEVRRHAYAPYSKFPVAAALLSKAGEVYTGVNVENASYGLTICAEQVAIGSAVAAGETTFEAIAVVVKGGGSPCGACRQVLNEFSPNLKVIMADEEGRVVRAASLDELLPEAFGPNSL